MINFINRKSLFLVLKLKYCYFKDRCFLVPEVYLKHHWVECQQLYHCASI